MRKGRLSLLLSLAVQCFASLCSRLECTSSVTSGHSMHRRPWETWITRTYTKSVVAQRRTMNLLVGVLGCGCVFLLWMRLLCCCVLASLAGRSAPCCAALLMHRCSLRQVSKIHQHGKHEVLHRRQSLNWEIKERANQEHHCKRRCTSMLQCAWHVISVCGALRRRQRTRK